MTERELSQILLIRSVEECDPHFFSPEMLITALKGSGDAENDDIALVQKRADYLFHKLPHSLKGIPQTVHLSKSWVIIFSIVVFFIGIVFNYLGPGDKIHILYNPVVLLIFWNIFVFAIILITHFLKKKNNGVAPHLREKPPLTIQSNELHNKLILSHKSLYSSSVPRWLLRKIWFSLHQLISKKKHNVKQFTSSLKITYQYLEYWWDINQNVFFARFARSVHLLAVCLVAGALVGIYIRGLFFVYTVVWKSTFIQDPTDIALILNIIFGLPSQLLHGTFIEKSSINLLIGPHGEPAAAWIHIFALSAFIFVIPQRFFLMFIESRKVKTLTKNITIDPREQYYARYIKLAKEIQANRLQEEISAAVQIEVTKLSEFTALYVRNSFYDKQVVPQLNHFRNNGGRIRDFENEIVQQSEKFKFELNSFLESAQEDFKKSLSENVSRVIGKKLSAIEVDVQNRIHVKPDIYREALDGPVTHNMTNAISIAVTAAVAATVGTISGGFGKVLGIAVISSLMHTSGPVGFIIGALAGLLLGGSASILAKDKITSLVKNQKYPAFFTKLMLRESKLSKTVEQGRINVYTLINKQIEKRLIPHVDEITNQILSNIALVINQRQE